MEYARELWLRIETIHAVTYFGAETVAAGESLGLGGFWFGYFGFRAAPLGPVGSGAVEAMFNNFAASFVQRWVPRIWDVATPEVLIDARSTAAAATLTRLVPDITDFAGSANATLQAAVERGVAAGRPMFAANRVLALGNDPVRRLWQLCTSLREHRGDGHVAALTVAGLDGIEANVLIATEQSNSAENMRRARGWVEADWDAAVQRCTTRGLIDASGGLSDAGRGLRAEVEARTDALAALPFASLTDAERDALIAVLDPPARAISGSATIRYPNPMGLPPLSPSLS